VAAGRTSLTVAHRLSTIAGADLVLSLADGRVEQVSALAESRAEEVRS
jgi:ABC-type transport system involved in Fe-S cluster assembly fused permease/ATPase subunit